LANEASQRLLTLANEASQRPGYLKVNLVDFNTIVFKA